MNAAKEKLDPATCALWTLRLRLVTDRPPELAYKDDTWDDEDPAARFEETFADRVPLDDAPERALHFCPVYGCPSEPDDRLVQRERSLVLHVTPVRAGKNVHVRCTAGCSERALGRAIEECILSAEPHRARDAIHERPSRSLRPRPRIGGVL